MTRTSQWDKRDYSTTDRKSTRLNSSHSQISYAVFCLKKKKEQQRTSRPNDFVVSRRTPAGVDRVRGKGADDETSSAATYVATGCPHLVPRIRTRLLTS